ncbi:mechanosensitive ion channel family protein [Reyranella sp.]|uniref:mechanosensitive ion channel family protein n=1 Tax=Reyranella sp. TaxID=1929291 RepID=UPI003BAA6951
MSSPHRLASLTLPFALLAALPAFAQTPADPGGAGTSSVLAKRLEHARQHFEEIVQAIPGLPGDFGKVGHSLGEAAGSDGILRILLGAVLCLAVGFAVEWGFRRATQGPRTRRSAIPIRQLSDRLTRVGMDALLDIGAILAFAVGALVTLAALSWSPPIHEAGLALLTALVGTRLADVVLCILLRPRPGLDRELAAFDLDVGRARFWRSRLLAFVAWFAFGWAVIAATRVLGMPRGGLLIFAYLLGTGLVAIAIAMIWSPKAPTPADDARPDAVKAGNAGRWLATLGAVVFWLVWAAGAMHVFWFLTVAVGLPLAIAAARRASRHLLRPVSGPDGTMGPQSVLAVFVEQGLRAALIVGAIGILLWGWGLDVTSLAEKENTFTKLLRGSLHALIIVLVADLAWSLLKALADNALVNAQPADGLAAEEARRRARVRTLLPIGRNIALIVLVVMAALMALAALGVEIGPLIASAGVVGVAVGFGAQTVVRDMISGMFYMLDDAFRVGEYIQSGSYKGVVESFSLRSVKLRHQRGPLFTIPFGVLGAVQNMSRDWVMVKDQIGITYDSDVDKAKKLIKQIGLELAKDPDLGPNILQPLKMQGIEQFGEYSINIRMKMMTKPGEQFVIRRKANAMIKKAFDENGIHFAFPTVQLAGGGGGDHEAAVAVAARKVLKAEAAPPA